MAAAAIRILSRYDESPPLLQRHNDGWRKCQRNYFILNIFMASLASSAQPEPFQIKQSIYLRSEWEILIFR